MDLQREIVISLRGRMLTDFGGHFRMVKNSILLNDNTILFHVDEWRVEGRYGSGVSKLRQLRQESHLRVGLAE